jgi:Arc/MetJ family transcription regulator
VRDLVVDEYPLPTRIVVAAFVMVETDCVYHTCMSKTRTNIEIEETYVEIIKDRYGVRTKTEAVDLALRHLAGQPMTRDEALEMRGAHAILDPPDDSVSHTLT